MSNAFLNRVWDAIKPPPPAPRREQDHAFPAEPSWFDRAIEAIKPPAAVKPDQSRLSLKERRHRRRILIRAASVVALGGAAWGGYLYVSSAPARAEQVFQDGVLLMGKGDFKAADARFTRAVDIWPQLASAFLQRGLARRGEGQTDAAIEDFEHAASLDRNLGQAHTELGLIYRERGDMERAVNELTLSINQNANTDALYQRAQLYAALGQHAKAVADYNAAIQQQTDAPYVYRARAMSRDALGDHDGAEQDRARATQIERR